MTIGIDASRAFLSKRTGIEEYSYQVIKQLRNELAKEQVVLYVRKKNGEWGMGNGENAEQKTALDFDLPESWKVKELWGPRVWTQGRLALEMFLHPPDVLFVPAHTVPWIHPKNTVVTIHGLEYEFCPEAYSRWERWYMRWSIKNSCRWASKIVAVSENTKRDLVRLYSVPEEKICVIYEGAPNFQFSIFNFQSKFKIQISKLKPYFLFVGRIEMRKNVARMIEAFDLFKKKCGTEHKIVLAGKPGFGYEKIENCKLNIENSSDVIELGYVSEEEKWELLRGTEGFLFPSLYEGFGLPVLEAQAVGVPVLTSSTSSLPEISGRDSVILQDGGLQPRPHVSVNNKVRRNKKSMLQTCSCRKDGAILVDPLSVEDIALGIEKLALDRGFRGAIIENGLKNVKRFSWEKCAREIAGLLKGK